MSDGSHENPIEVSLPAETGPVHRCRHCAMACTWELYILGQEQRYVRQAAHAAFEEVDRIERELSRFVPQSDIARLNALPAGRPLRLGVEAFECLELAAEIHRDTGGAFDVTIGALLMSPDDQPASPPVDNRCHSTGPPPPFGMQLLEIDRTAHTVTVHADGLVVDLGGVGKGYALDCVAAVLGDWSIDAALIHCGQSTARALGGPHEQQGWTVALRSPVGPGASLASVCLRERALSGSGARLHGRHIIDPRTGRPAAGTLGAWALVPSAARADALSTAFMVLRPPEVADYCHRRPEVSGLLYVETPTSHVVQHYGTGFETIEEPYAGPFGFVQGGLPSPAPGGPVENQSHRARHPRALNVRRRGLPYRSGLLGPRFRA